MFRSAMGIISLRTVAPATPAWWPDEDEVIEITGAGKNLTDVAPDPEPPSPNGSGMDWVYDYWCGFAFGPRGIYMPAQGGHNGSADRSHYGLLDFEEANPPNFTTLQGPGTGFTTNTCGLANNDGRPPSHHGYNAPFYILGVGVCLPGMSAVYGDGNTACPELLTFNEGTNTWTSRGTLTPHGNVGGTGCWDRTHNRAFYLSKSPGSLIEIDPNNGYSQTVRSTGFSHDIYGTLLCDWNRNLLLYRNSDHYALWDSSNPAAGPTDITSLIPSFSIRNTSGIGMWFQPTIGANGAFVCYNGGTTIFILTPSASPFSTAWSVSSRTLSAPGGTPRVPVGGIGDEWFRKVGWIENGNLFAAIDSASGFWVGRLAA